MQEQFEMNQWLSLPLFEGGPFEQINAGNHQISLLDEVLSAKVFTTEPSAKKPPLFGDDDWAVIFLIW